MRVNMNIFPRGYIENYKNKPVKDLAFVADVKKGIFNGQAAIYINGKKVCKTRFQDQIELIRAWNHPVGPSNYISTDLAAFNCFLGLISMVCFGMSTIYM